MRSKREMLRRWVTLSVLFSTLLFAGACSGHGRNNPGNDPYRDRAGNDTVGEDRGDGSLARIRRQGELRVGFAPSAPHAVAKDGSYVGFDMEIAERLAMDLGVKMKPVPTPISELIPNLREGRYDIILSGYTITPERALFVEYTPPIADLTFLLVAGSRAAKGGARVPASDDPMEWNNPTRKIGAVCSTVAEAVLREQLPAAERVSVATYDDLLAQVQHGELAGMIVPQQIAQAAVAKSQTSKEGRMYIVAGAPLGARPEAIAVRRGDRDLLTYLNSWIAFYQASGWIAERRHHWFDSVEWAACLADGNRDAGLAKNEQKPVPQDGARDVVR